MAKDHRFLAFDFGAESGRAVLGTLANSRITLEEIRRFPTEGIMLLGTRQWDVTRIYGEMLTALRKCAQNHGPALAGIGVDTWGVDFGLVARDGTILGNPVHYRDHRTDGMLEAACETVPRNELYRMTGIQCMGLNTLYQLLALVKSNSPLLEIAESFLMMGDLFGYMLSGKQASEYTNASTTQLLDPWKRTWYDDLIAKLGLPRRIFMDLTQPGTVLGALLPDVADDTGLAPDTRVLVPATHDTGSAVAAVPAQSDQGDWAYLSSGTWSLLGVELDAPHVSDASAELEITNEGGVDGTIRFLKNIIGLWLVQECRRVWTREGEDLDYDRITAEAEEAQPFAAFINVDDDRFLRPDDMPAEIQGMCKETGQTVPATRGAITRCALESLALKYRRTLRAIDRVLDRKTERLHVIGGGTQNKLLCQMTADACGIPVLAGPVEATALGNILVQAMAVGAIKSLAEGRDIIARSVAPDRYEPADPAPWDKADALVR